MSEKNRLQKPAGRHKAHLMFTPKRGKILMGLFIGGALGRSLAIGLGLTRVGALIGLVAMVAVLYGGLWSLLAPTVEDKLFRPLQRLYGLILIIVWVIFSISMIMELWKIS